MSNAAACFLQVVPASMPQDYTTLAANAAAAAAAAAAASLL
jgi:hypothetical protein